MTAMVLLSAWMRSQVEFWRPVIGFQDYDVSSFGRVRSRKYANSRFLKARSQSGYLNVRLYGGGRSPELAVHRLVALAFIPNPQNLREVNHINGRKEHNWIGNLAWVSTSDNQLHAYRVGLSNPLCGVENSNAKLTERDVVMIRKLYKPRRVTLMNLAEEYGVSFQHISRIVNGINRCRG